MSTDPGDLRIDDLARQTGVTVRNLRSYQDRGLLPPPRRDGRVGWYTDAHVARVRLIASLLERGFSLANIAELLETWEGGRNLGDLIGLGGQITGPYTDEVADAGTPEEISTRYGLPLTDLTAATDALALGLIEIDGDRVRVPSPRLLRAGVELNRAGVPFPELFAELRRLRTDIEAISERLVRLVVTHVFEPHLVDGVPVAERVPELAENLARVRPLATTVVDAELARALHDSATAELGARLTTFLAAQRSEATG